MKADPERERTPRERYKSKETLKILLINLCLGYQSGVAVKYSRRKSAFSGNSRYARLFFSYDRVIPIVDKLVELEYVQHWKGFNDREKEIRRLSRMAAAPRLVDLFHEYGAIHIQIQRSAPTIEDLVICRDQTGKPIKIENTRSVELMQENLIRYNKFIEQQVVEYRLSSDTMLNLHFLHNLKNLTCNGSVEITYLSTQNDLTVNYGDKEYKGYEINSKNFLLLGDESAADLAYLLTDVRATRSNYHQYFKQYHQHYLTQFHQSSQPNSPTNTTLSPILSMTGTFSQIDQQYQSSKCLKNDHDSKFRQDKVERPLSSYGIYNLHYRSNYQYLHRVFNNKWLDAGGRFYGALQTRLPQEVRKCIFINGSPTVELDYSGHHIRMLYHDHGIDYQEDPYQILCAENPKERQIYKTVLLLSINAPSQKSAVKAIRHELWEKGYSREFLTDDFIISCMEKFKAVHVPVAQFLNVGIGITLQYQDSLITDRILNQMTKNAIPALPVHDSYIVPVEHADELNETMISAYKAIMDGYKPVIKGNPALRSGASGSNTTTLNH